MTGWKCGDCGIWLAPSVKEHRCLPPPKLGAVPNLSWPTPPGPFVVGDWVCRCGRTCLVGYGCPNCTQASMVKTISTATSADVHVTTDPRDFNDFWHNA